MSISFHCPAFRLAMLIACLVPAAGYAAAATLEVGPGKTFARIEDANAKARPGDVVLVYAGSSRRQYEKTAIFVRQREITFRGVPAAGKSCVPINGHGFDYSGAGSTPRAVFQFNAGADHCTLEGFELFGAHNSSHNGAGVRINQANHVTVRNCSIHGNDMGVMSNGDGTLARGVDQLFERCEIFRNGDTAEPGQNHNLYLGGTSATLRFCEVHHSLTGHNVKSRAHYTRVEYCYVHHSANREFDLVDAAETVRPESDAVLLGNIIAKDPRCAGNHGVLHFGQDGGKGRNGTLYLAFNTIVTPFLSPVIELSTAGAKARLSGNIVACGGSRGRPGKRWRPSAAGRSWKTLQDGRIGFAATFPPPARRLTPAENHFERQSGDLFIDARADDYRLLPASARRMTLPRLPALLDLPPVPGTTAADAWRPLTWQYRHPANGEKRAEQDNATAGRWAAQKEPGNRAARSEPGRAPRLHGRLAGREGRVRRTTTPFA